MSTVADPSNANTDQTGYDATSLVFESALIVSHHLGKQLGMDIDGTGNSVNCPATGYIMADRTDDDRYRPEAAGKFSQFSRCSAATLERQLPTYTRVCSARPWGGRFAATAWWKGNEARSATAAAGTRTACARSLTARSSTTRTATRRRVFSSRRSSRTRRRRLRRPRRPRRTSRTRGATPGAARLA